MGDMEKETETPQQLDPPAAVKPLKAHSINRPRKTGKSGRRKRTVRPYPAGPFEEAFQLAEQIQKFASGRKVRRLTLFKEMNKSPTSSGSVMLITNSGKYGITVGSYAAEWLELTPKGALASNPSNPIKLRLQAKFDLAISGILPFKALYDEYCGKKLPAREVMKDFLSTVKSSIGDTAECIDLFIVNTKYLGLLQTIAGSEVLTSIEQVIDEIKNNENGSVPATPSESPIASESSNGFDKSEVTNWTATCFYIAPIGAEGSEARRHSDLFLNAIVEPALKDFNLNVVRADKIGESGMITSQVLEHLLKSKLVIVDLSLHNPNVFYELAVRHASKLPIVQIIRKADKIPFDVDQMRTIQIDTTDIYSLVPKLETYRSELATHVRQAIASSDSVNNPLTVFCPGFQVIFPK